MPRTATAQRKKSIYSVHPGVLMTQKWIGELKQKTGRSVEEWLAHIKKTGPKGEQERRAWLKEKYGLGTNTAGWLAEAAEGKADIGRHIAIHAQQLAHRSIPVLTFDAHACAGRAGVSM